MAQGDWLVKRWQYLAALLDLISLFPRNCPGCAWLRKR
jgi:hypothetical protein